MADGGGGRQGLSRGVPPPVSGRRLASQAALSIYVLQVGVSLATPRADSAGWTLCPACCGGDGLGTGTAQDTPALT